MSISNARSGLLALTLGLSAGIHAALVPEHLREMPPLGYLFIAASAVGTAIAVAVVARPNDTLIARGALTFLLAQIICWAAFVSLPIPGFAGTPESIETIAVVCKAVEVLGVILALPLALGPLRADHQLNRTEPASVDRR